VRSVEDEVRRSMAEKCKDWLYTDDDNETILDYMKPVHNSESDFPGLFEVGELRGKENPKAEPPKVLNCWKNST
jgi:hypothetical protein